MSGRILVDVSEPERFSSSPEVVIGLTAALHGMFQVPAEVIDVVVDRRPGSAYAVQYAVTMEGAASTGSMIRAKEALIAATPHEIAQLFQREVNSRVAKAFVIVVMEVEPPTIHGSVDDFTSTSGGRGEGIIFDPQVSHAPLMMARLFGALLCLWAF